MSNDYYLKNPLLHRDRRLGRRTSDWVGQFACVGLRPLIICRGPVRKEAMDVFEEMGITGYGMLLSEKDSIVYRNALAPELRQLTDPDRVHRVPDYSGASKVERDARIQQIIRIARDNGYNAIFAGYGFMAEDETMVAAVQDAGLTFIGPGARTVRNAGLKDEAIHTARELGISVTPGVDNATSLTLLQKYPDADALAQLIDEHELELEAGEGEQTLEQLARRVLAAAHERRLDLYSVDELCATLNSVVSGMAEQYPQHRLRLKAVGGGGGKGQRILGRGEAARTEELVREILGEVKATGEGDNRNVLVELNIETTRHQEIQVLGNGQWTLAMGGRDCSLQMHEQKLLEVSITQESLQGALAEAQAQGQQQEAQVLEQELATLRAMEGEAERFGEAVGLDSVSTFECIVDGDQHYFMEMNTRIQVEHRVTELCYGLKFSNPQRPDDSFVVESLVEAMVLLAVHGDKLPRPERVPRHNDTVEVRLNATNAALQPHAGGVVEYWSDPMEGEIRDDQGISLHNPDTDVFMKYTLAGAYDSNIALLLSVGESRQDCYRHMTEVLRRTSISGRDLATNREFHYGLLNWLLGQNPQARPTTGFVLPYLAAVGELLQRAATIDLDYCYRQLGAALQARLPEPVRPALANTLERKYSLLCRPLEKLLAEPHLLSGWLSAHRDSYRLVDGKIRWNRNPLELLADSYHFLDMDFRQGPPAAEMIWDHDNRVLQEGVSFYEELKRRFKAPDWEQMQTHLAASKAPLGFGKALWRRVRGAHAGYQSGLDILALLPFIAEASGYFQLRVEQDLGIHIPERLLDRDLQQRMLRLLAPPPVASADEILAQSGGMFYPRESPDQEVFVGQGSHFAAGDPLYIVEVMKMFNKVHASYSGTIDQVLVEGDGVIVSKGQPLFKVTPDEQPAVESAAEIQARQRRCSDEFLACINGGSEP